MIRWFIILHRVSNFGEATAKDIKMELSVSEAHARVTLERMRKWGFVKRRKSPEKTGGRPAYLYRVTWKAECFMDWADRYWGSVWYDEMREEVERFVFRDSDMGEDEYRSRLRNPQFNAKSWQEYYRFQKLLY
ncbi:MAG: hypothetical protein QF766_03110 [Candidatus Poseidoniia archaeon]|jgi:predicted transcriptional regulator|nr:hypothetical protein [Candidatus Poseidoniia archaeon]MDP7243315.1 hypothetical protein [Candidatus Poseidoniia archaeon]MDP7535753.1 hypothetical protein [Candidatus Poseidoniia archaeon]MDP7607759.1 hypothetical protein [Candidatus Poseidoniia archaeon]HJP44073.1 hypothetical protein [Candidatus Poseidoniia archaeon]|tara:strand:+ start:1090 stop:1488 length:399 start_codon:yes stop_codon:yes gene_type:complete